MPSGLNAIVFWGVFVLVVSVLAMAALNALFSDPKPNWPCPSRIGPTSRGARGWYYTECELEANHEMPHKAGDLKWWGD